MSLFVFISYYEGYFEISLQSLSIYIGLFDWFDSIFGCCVRIWFYSTGRSFYDCCDGVAAVVDGFVAYTIGSNGIFSMRTGFGMIFT